MWNFQNFRNWLQSLGLNAIFLLAIPVVGFFALTGSVWGPALLAVFTAKHDGVIIVNSPTVYTRQRLVNDRLSQTAWLKEQLDVTVTRRDPAETFRTIDAISSGINQTKTKATLGVGKTEADAPSSPKPENNPKPEGPADDNGTSNGPSTMLDSSNVGVTPTTADLFRAKNAYREEVRAEMMEAQLDDRHDIDGNTIHRLAFNATVIPGTRLDELAVVKVKLSHDPNSPQMAGGYNKLYEDWLRKMQETVDQAVDQIGKKIAERNLDSRLTTSLPRFILKRVCELLYDPQTLFRRSKCVPTAAAKEDAKSLISKTTAIINDFTAEYLKLRKTIQTSIGRANIRNALKGKDGNSFQFISLDRVCDPTSLAIAFANQATAYDPNQGTQVSPGQGEGATGSEDQNKGTPAPSDPNQVKSVDRTRPPPSNWVLAKRELSVEARDLEAADSSLIFECPTFDGPTEGIFAGLYLYSQLFGRVAIEKRSSSPEEIVAGITSDLSKECQTISPNCNLPDLTRSAFRCAAADYMREYLNFFGDSPLALDRQPLTRYLDMEFFGPDTGSCSVFITDLHTQKAGENPGVGLLRTNLNSRIELYSYAVTPKNLVQHIATALDTRNTIQALATAKGSELSSALDRLQQKSNYNRAIEANPIVLGFGLAGGSPVSAPDSNDYSTEFGWIIAPQMRVGSDAREQVDAQYGLSAVVSLPAWWPAVRLDIVTCWIPKSSLHLYQQSALCSGDNPPESRIVRLPVAIAEVSHKLAFEVVQQPYIFQSTTRNVPFDVTAGQPAALLIRGNRLWRSTEVTLGSQRADEIVVLPDMDGIIAKFKCVERQMPLVLQVKVFTSEGTAEPEYARINGTKQAMPCPQTLRDLGLPPPDAKPSDRAAKPY